MLALVLPPKTEPTFTSNKNNLYSYDSEFAVSEAESNAIDLTLVVPIFVFETVAVDVVLIEAFATQCKSTVCKLLIGNEPTGVLA